MVGQAAAPVPFVMAEAAVVIIIVVPILTFVALYFGHHSHSTAMRPQLPGPRVLKYTNLQARLIEILLTLSKGSGFINTLHQRHGQVVQISRNEVSTNGGAALRDLYSVSRRLDRPGPLAIFHNNQAENLVSTESGDLHHERRKPLRSIYSASAIDAEETQVAIQTSMSRLLKHLESLQNPVEIKPILRQLLYEVMSHVVYGKSHALNLFDDPNLCSAISADTAYQESRLFSPFVLLPAFFPRFTLWLRRNNLAPASISGNIPSNLVSDRLGREALAALKACSSSSSPKLAVEPLIARLHGHFSTHGPSPAVPSEAYILSDALDHFWAGSSTTLDALVPLFHHLARPENKARQERLRAELGAAAADADSLDRIVGGVKEAQLRKMKYLDAVIRETLRRDPPIPVSMSRRVPKSEGLASGLEVCGHKIPSGMVIGAAPLVLGRNGDVYEQPDEWRPERWLLAEDEDGVGKEKMLEMKRCFFAFGAGPRMCLGVNVAWATMRAVVAGVAGRFEIEAVPGEKGSWWRGDAEEKLRFRRLDV